jgi:type II secretory pathway pseudopilin PulG
MAISIHKSDRQTATCFLNSGGIITPGSSARRRAGGFTILEQLIAASIAILVFGSLFMALSSGFNVTQLTQENLRATQIITEKMELLRLFTWQQITNGTSIPTNFTDIYYPDSVNQGVNYTGVVSVSSAPFVNDYSPCLREVTVTVNWLSGNVARSRSACTLVSSNGLQSYVY